MLLGLPFLVAARAALILTGEVEQTDTKDARDEQVIRHVKTDDGRHVLAEVDGNRDAWIASRKTLPLPVYR